MLRRTIALLMLVVVFASSVEVLWAEGFEGLQSDQSELMDSATDVAGTDANDGEDECSCLCACSCAGVLSVVVPPLIAFQPVFLDASSPTPPREGTPVSSFVELHLRPPLA
ncbi:MAG: hypothetical protein ACYC28_06400 [Longimicrobiales bacterium]